MSESKEQGALYMPALRLPLYWRVLRRMCWVRVPRRPHEGSTRWNGAGTEPERHHKLFSAHAMSEQGPQSTAAMEPGRVGAGFGSTCCLVS